MSTIISRYCLHMLNPPPTKTASPYFTADVLNSIYFHKQIFQIFFYKFAGTALFYWHEHWHALRNTHQLTEQFINWCAKPSYFAKVFTVTTQSKDISLLPSIGQYNHMPIIFCNLEASTKKFIFVMKPKGTTKHPCKLTLSQGLLKLLMRDEEGHAFYVLSIHLPEHSLTKTFFLFCFWCGM